VAVVLIRTLNQDKRVYRRQQDDLPEHVKGKAYFEFHGTGHRDTRYYINLPKKTHGVIEFVKVEDEDYWVKLLWKNDLWITNQGGVLHTSKLGNWKETDPQHPHYINPEHFSPTLHTAIKQPEEEILAGGAHHITTLQGSHPFTEQAPILPQIEAAVHQGIPIPLDTTPAGAVQPQLSIQTTVAEQIDTTIMGPEGQQQPNINIINHNSNGALKGNPSPIFDGDRSKSRTFLIAFYLWRLTNKHNDTMRKPYSHITTLLSYMNGPQVDSWKEEQLDKLIEEINDGTQETDETLWDSFIESFKQAYTNTNLREEVLRSWTLSFIFRHFSPIYSALSVTCFPLVPLHATWTATQSPDKSPDGPPDHSAVRYHMPSLRSLQHSAASLFNPLWIASLLPRHDETTSS